MKRWVRLLLQLLGILLFVVIAWWAGAESWRQVLYGRPLPLLQAAILTGAAQMLSARRLQRASQTVTGQRLGSWRAFYSLTMTAQVLGLILPRGVSAVGGKTVGLRAFGASLKRSAWIIMLDNGFDVGLLSLLVLPGILFLQGDWPVPLYIVVLLLVLGLAALIVAYLGWRQPWRALANLLARIPRVGRSLADQLAEADTLFPGVPVALELLLLTTAINFLLALRYYFIGQAIALPVGWPTFLAMFPATQLSLVIALAPGGLGVFELGWVGLLRLAGNEGTAFAIAQRAYTTVINLFWAGFSYLLSLAAGRLGSGPRNPLPP